MARAYRRLIIPVIGLKCPVKVMGANPYLATSLTKPVKGRGSMPEAVKWFVQKTEEMK